MEYPFIIHSKSEHSPDTNNQHTIFCIGYFVALTSLAALSSTPAAKTIITSILPIFSEIAELLAVK